MTGITAGQSLWASRNWLDSVLPQMDRQLVFHVVMNNLTVIVPLIATVTDRPRLCHYVLRFAGAAGIEGQYKLSSFTICDDSREPV